MKLIFSVLLLLVQSCFALAEEKPLRPLDPSYMGVHGMVLVSHSSTIYASHLPLYHKPHDVQLIYKLESKDLALLQTVRDGRLTTIKPQPFNLDQLIRGDKLVITADVYAGHFERGGMLVYENMTLNFSKQLYVRKLTDIAESSTQQEYDAISLSKNYKIYVHRIQQAPSYDQLIHIDVEAGCLSRFKTSSAVPTEQETQFKFINCGSMTPLYFETEDFKKH